MNLLIRVLKEIFDFFCGDWRIFSGVAVTVLLVALTENNEVLAPIRPAAAPVFIIGISLSLVISLKRYAKH